MTQNAILIINKLTIAYPEYLTFARRSESGYRHKGNCDFRAEKRKKHARTLRERRAPKVSKMAAISIFLFSTIYYATADIPVSSDNFPHTRR